MGWLSGEWRELTSWVIWVSIFPSHGEPASLSYKLSFRTTEVGMSQPCFFLDAQFSPVARAKKNAASRENSIERFSIYIFLSTCLLRQGWFVWFVSVTCWPHSDANSVTSKSLATGMPGSCIRNGGDYPGDAETAEKGESSRNGLEIFPLTCENMVISWILNGNP